MRPVLLHGGADLFALRGRQVEIARDLRPAPPGVDSARHLRPEARRENQRDCEQASHALFLEQSVYRLDGFGLAALLHGGEVGK